MVGAVSNRPQGFDETSNIWVQPFSALINCMFPVEYVYADWFGWQTWNEAQREDQESLVSPSEATIVAGSRVEGFCIPQFFLRKTDVERGSVVDFRGSVLEHWQPDLDRMEANDSFVENSEKKLIPIFTVEHIEDDPKYAKLRLTKEWKDHRPRYKNVSYLHHSFLLPSADEYHSMAGLESNQFDGQKGSWSYDLHGPVRKLESEGFPSYEEDQTGVFEYPIAWPEPAMEWLVRPRPSGWPSPELVQEIFDAGCHLAPVGRGKRIDDPVDLLSYCQNPELSGASSAGLQEECKKGKMTMDNTEWKTSFSVAENKLGESVSPVQRHVVVLLKMIKSCYFPKVISTYCLKHLLFWESERRQAVFWREDNSANCLLLILDRLQECLEAHRLPHFFIPRSNTLEYEDPSKMNEAAAIVAEVRRNILPKTVNLLKRLQSLTYQSNSYLQGLGLLLEDHLLKMQDRNISNKDHRQLLCSLHSVFVSKCKDVITDLQRISPAERQKIEKLVNVSLYAYQSTLSRTMCKLWLLHTDERNDQRKSEDEFKLFVKEKVRDLSFDEDFLALALVFFARARNGMEPSLAIPYTRVMNLLREEQMGIAKEGMEEVHKFLKGTLFDSLKRSDLEKIEEKVSKKLQNEVDFMTVTNEEVLRFFSEELATLFEDKM
ncbi:hypothetical protein ACROYT_G011996 [Oculina patagonica]